MVKTSARPVYVIYSGGKLNRECTDIPPCGINYIETVCKVLGKTFGEAAKLEECRKEVDEDYSKRVPNQRTAARGQTTFEKHVLHQNIRYTLGEDLEQVRKVFGACDRRLVAEEVLRVQDINPEKAMRILPYLDVHFSRKELERIYSGMPAQKRNTIENIDFFTSEEYKAHLDAFKNGPRSRKDNKCMINTIPSGISPETPSP